jgi:hypothetical protein
MDLGPEVYGVQDVVWQGLVPQCSELAERDVQRQYRPLQRLET